MTEAQKTRLCKTLEGKKIRQVGDGFSAWRLMLDVFPSLRGRLKVAEARLVRSVVDGLRRAAEHG